MGRLTLKVLLSFARFDREVIGEQKGSCNKPLPGIRKLTRDENFRTRSHRLDRTKDESLVTIVEYLDAETLGLSIVICQRHLVASERPAARVAAGWCDSHEE